MQRRAAFDVLRASSKFRSLLKRDSTSAPGAEETGDGAAAPLLGPNGVQDLLNVSSPPPPHRAPLGLLSDVRALWGMCTESWINVLLVFVPLGLVAEWAGWSPVAVFVLNFLALVPLALILGDITEDLAIRFGQTIGGLINATFGNVVELILSIAALQQGLYSVVATSLIGSILSNLLLVLGGCFLFGGMKHHVQSWSASSNQVTSSLLYMACIGIVIPSVAGRLPPSAANWVVGDVWGPGHPDFILDISRFSAIVLLAIYICYLVFQLGTHADMFTGGEEEEEEPIMTLAGAFAALAVITVTVAACSEFLTGSIEAFTESTGMSKAFVGMIVLPIAGNACEHITAIIVAMKDKMDLALGVAVGSSIQIALFAIPFVVLVGWATGHPFGLDFDLFAVLVLTMSVVHANFVTNDAHSHWLMGVQLIAVYVLIAITFLYR